MEVPGKLPHPTVEEGDWIKAGTWDMHTVHGGIWTPVTDLPGLLDALGVSQAPVDVQKARLIAFMGLVAWRAAPPGLPAAAEQFLTGPPPRKPRKLSALAARLRNR